MRTSGFKPGFVYTLAGLVAGALFAISAPHVLAQGGVGSGAGTMERATRSPYTATWTEKRVQTLANGATVTHESTTKFVRDSSGRTYTETHQTLPAGSNEEARETVMYHISDPVERTTTMWNSSSKEATVNHMPERTTAQPQLIPKTTAAQASPAARQNPDVQREDLGTKNIAGVNAKGTRITRVIPAGRDGNDEPITTVQETWMSTEYAIVLMSVNEDPRYGTTTREVTELTPGEPDVALFRLPEGYTVREIAARTVVNQ
jgi:hypothetical protein